MNPLREQQLLLTRRHFFGRAAVGLGAAALGSILNPNVLSALAAEKDLTKLPLGQPHYAPKAKRVIYLFMAGGPAQMDLLDYKPTLEKLHQTELPSSVRMGQRLTGMTSGQSSFPVVKSLFKFSQHGNCGAWVSELLPHIAGMVDDIAIVKTVNTEAINHDPAITYIQTGFQQPGRPCVGSWLSYGLGSENQNLPAFIVMISNGKESDQPLYTRLWGSGFLPSQFQGVQFRGGSDPVLFLSNPPGIDSATRRRMLDGMAKLNARQHEMYQDPEITTRIQQYEMAFRMQTSVPELVDVSKESPSTLELYGPDVTKPGSFAYNCLLARRMAERGVRFIQLYHRGWDQHNNLPKRIREQCKDTDQASAALVQDLKARGMLDETLVVWGGEFGRTVYSQGKIEKDNYGRDHHGRNYSIWMSGGGIKPGISYGETDDFCYNVVENPVHIHDMNATILHCLGLNHEKLTYRFQGRDFRLTDIHGNVVKGLLA
ncbi:MAG: sulfatase [Verrucomicrobia bacterium]|nr:MAG: sulfatase [Verrucomicrobiota bacterium]